MEAATDNKLRILCKLVAHTGSRAHSRSESPTMRTVRPAAVLLLAGLSAAQAPLAPSHQVVAASGNPFQPVPGALIRNLAHAAIDGYGNLACRVDLQLNNGITAENDTLICYGRTAEDLVVVAREGDPEPSGILGTFLRRLDTPLALSPRDGQVLWGAELMDASTPPNVLGYALYAGSPTAPVLLARAGAVLPGTATLCTALDFRDMATCSASGRMVFRAGVEDPVQGTVLAMVTGMPGQLEVVSRIDDVWPEPGGPLVGFLLPGDEIAADGAFPFRLELRTGTGLPPVSSDTDRVCGCYVPGVGVRTLLRDGDPAPGTNGALIEQPDLPSVCVGLQGEVLIVTRLRGGDTVGQTNNWAWYTVAMGGGAPQLLLRTGTQLADGSIVASLGSATSRGPGGESIASVRITHPNAPGVFRDVLVRCSQGQVTELLRSGDAVPGLPGVTFGQSAGGAIQRDAHGNHLFPWNLDEGNGEVQGWFTWHATDGVRLQMRAGEVLPTPMGPLTLSNAPFVDWRASGDGGGSGFGRHGDLAALVNVGNPGGVALVRASVGPLQATPASIPATGGTQTWRFTAGAARAGSFYLVVGSLSGTAPGFVQGGVTIPLAFDFWTSLSQQSANSAVYLNSLGTLDAAGAGAAGFALPWNVPFLRGALFHHAVLVLDPATADLTWVSQPAGMRVY